METNVVDFKTKKAFTKEEADLLADFNDLNAETRAVALQIALYLKYLQPTKFRTDKAVLVFPGQTKDDTIAIFNVGPMQDIFYQCEILHDASKRMNSTYQYTPEERSHYLSEEKDDEPA